MLILGEKEVADNTVAVRKHGEGDKGVMPVEEFAKMINEEVSSQTASI
jgi:threonyl-tRNA synthetase